MLTSTEAEKLMKLTKKLPNNEEINIENPKPSMQNLQTKSKWKQTQTAKQ